MTKKKCGIVSIVGRPNVGKSTLLNTILNTKLVITSNVSGTTRNVIQGIYHDSDSQIVFVDTPGIHKPVNKLGNLLNKKAYQNILGVDIILFLIDAYQGFGKGDNYILNHLKDQNIPIFLLLNKIDEIKDKTQILTIINDLKDLYPFAEIIPLSALKQDNIKDLLESIKKYLKNGEPFYQDDELTNVSVRFMISELVREKILKLTKDEIPHTVTCIVENYEEEDNIVNIQVLIVVDRDNIKKIIIGKKGQLLKTIGIEARRDIEQLLHKKVYLTTHVKTIKNWRNKERYLLELGLKEIDE